MKKTKYIYLEKSIENRIAFLCNLYLSHYDIKNCMEMVAIDNRDVVLINYTNNTMIVSYHNPYHEKEDTLVITQNKDNVIDGYLISGLNQYDFRYDYKLFHVKHFKANKIHRGGVRKYGD